MMEQKYGLLGRRLEHSWSAYIHVALGCADYRLFEQEPEAVESFLGQGDLGGLNVTIPYKTTVLPYCAALDDTAAAIGAVNTLVFRDGRWTGHNTDAAGFAYMARRAGIEFSGKKVVILGSGGASRMAQYAARRDGAGEVVVISRSGADNYETIERHTDADVLVNCTPVGMYPDNGAAPVDLWQFALCRGVLDLVYNPGKTALLQQARMLGIPCSGGLPMLVEQARLAEELFTGRRIPVEETERILAALEREQTNIVLIGMPGSGKSTVGAALSALTGRELVETDALVEAMAGCSIPEIFAKHGERGFRALEQRATAEAGKRTGIILATGGGAVRNIRNRPALRQNGRIYHLLRDTDRLATAGRPLSQGANLPEMWEKRRLLYRAFRDKTADNNGTVGETAAAIWEDFSCGFWC